MLNNQVKIFLQDNKDIINKGEWGTLIKNSKSIYHALDSDDLNSVMNCLKAINVRPDPKKLFSGFSHSLTNVKTMHQDFYKEFNSNNIPSFQGETINEFDFKATADYRFDFKDVPSGIGNTIIGGSKLYIITDGTYIEFAIILYNDADQNDLLGIYYFYDHELFKNIVVLEEFGIGYNEKEIEGCIFNLIEGLN